MAAKTELVTIEARPQPIELDPTKTAVIVVDMQNDFGSEGGMFERAGIDISGIREVVPAIARVLDAARTAGMPVVYLKMGFSPDLADSGKPDAPNWLIRAHFRVGDVVSAPDGSESRILIRGTWNTEIIDELTPEDGDVVVDKHRYSGFFETELDSVLKDRGVSHLIFTGCTTSVCVESTVRDAMFRDYHCLVLEDCTAEPIGQGLPRSNHDASLLLVEVLFGSVTTSASLLSAMQVSVPSS
jgi:ureidoacrylate peracid hydrolase